MKVGTWISFLSDVLGDKYVYVLEDLIFCHLPTGFLCLWAFWYTPPTHPVFSEPCKLPLGFWQFTPVQRVLAENKGSDATYLGALTLCDVTLWYCLPPVFLGHYFLLSVGLSVQDFRKDHSSISINILIFRRRMFFTGTFIGEFNPIWICMVVSSGKVWLGTFCRDTRGIFCALQGSSGQFAGLRGMKII